MIDMTPKRSWMFSDFKPGKLAWLGQFPGEKRIEVEILNDRKDDGVDFYVLNGAWRGALYEGDEGALHIIDERGTRHDRVHLVEVMWPQRHQFEGHDDEEVPF